MKKQRTKKAATLMLAVMVSASVMLAACSSSNSTKNTTPTSEGNKPATASPSSEPTAKGPKPKITVSVYDRNNIPEGEGTITDNRWTKWINENAPVEVEFIAIPRTGGASSTEKLNVLFASNSAPDLIMEFSAPYMKDLASKGQIIALDDAIEKYSTTYKKVLQENPNLVKQNSFNGELYFIGRFTPLTTNHYLMIRKDWLDKLGLSAPTTTEEYLEVAKAFTEKDPDGNQKKDTLGSTLHDVDYFFQQGQASDEPIPMSMISSYHLINDEYVRTWDRPQANLAFKKSLYDAGVIDKDIFADKNGAKAQQDWVNGKLGIWGGDGLESAKGFGVFETLMNNNPDAKVEILPMPRSEFGQFSPSSANNMQSTAAINATAKNVEAVIAYIDWITSEEVARTLMFGFEGEHYKVDANGCPKPIDPEKNKKELNYNGDFQMMSQTGLMGSCVTYTNQLDPNKPLEKTYIDLIAQGKAAYITKDRPSTTDVILPVTTPDDLTMIRNTAKNTITNIYTKAIVSGSSYSVEQAMKDAKDAWEAAGGTKIDEFLAKAYKDHKNDSIFLMDLYK